VSPGPLTNPNEFQGRPFAKVVGVVGGGGDDGSGSGSRGGGVVEENSSARGHAGATARGQHTRAQAHVQSERGVRQAAAQGAHVRVREAPVPDRDAPVGHHVHRFHDRTAAVHTAAATVVAAGRRRCPDARHRRRRVRARPARRPGAVAVRAVFAHTARLGGTRGRKPIACADDDRI